MAVSPLARRPVYLASYDQPSEDTVVRRPRLRDHFPAAGDDLHGGKSDGHCFRITFAAGRMATTYSMLRQFLREEGYDGVPVPTDVDELRRFRLPPKLRHQLSLFGEDGYVHNPVKILFPPPGGKRGGLILELYNEQFEGHLLRFHRR